MENARQTGRAHQNTSTSWSCCWRLGSCVCCIRNVISMPPPLAAARPSASRPRAVSKGLRAQEGSVGCAQSGCEERGATAGSEGGGERAEPSRRGGPCGCRFECAIDAAAGCAPGDKQGGLPSEAAAGQASLSHTGDAQLSAGGHSLHGCFRDSCGPEDGSGRWQAKGDAGRGAWQVQNSDQERGTSGELAGGLLSRKTRRACRPRSGDLQGQAKCGAGQWCILPAMSSSDRRRIASNFERGQAVPSSWKRPFQAPPPPHADGRQGDAISWPPFTFPQASAGATPSQGACTVQESQGRG